MKTQREKNHSQSPGRSDGVESMLKLSIIKSIDCHPFFPFGIGELSEPHLIN